MFQDTGGIESPSDSRINHSPAFQGPGRNEATCNSLVLVNLSPNALGLLSAKNKIVLSAPLNAKNSNHQESFVNNPNSLALADFSPNALGLLSDKNKNVLSTPLDEDNDNRQESFAINPSMTFLSKRGGSPLETILEN